MDKTMEDANKHQGEQAYIELMQNIQTPSGRKSASPLPANFVIALNEERTRREECEKDIQQLQSQISSLQREKAVADASCQRKDSMLQEHARNWKIFESEWQEKLTLAESEKEQLLSKVARLEGQIQISVGEARKNTMEFQTAIRQSEQSLRNLQEENSRLKEKLEQSDCDLQRAMAQVDENKKEAGRSEIKLDESKREIRRLKNQIEDLKREKNKTDADLQLLEEKHNRNESEWETHVQAVRHASELDAERKLQKWQTEVESKMKDLVTTLKHQLGVLKTRSEEEMQLLQTRHQQELNALRSQCSALMSQCSALQQKVVLQEKMLEQITNSTNRMREQLNAQINEIDRLAPSSGAWQPKVSSATSEISDATISDSMSSNTLAKRADMQHYVSRQVMAPRLAAPPPLKGPNKRSDPAPSRKK